MRFFASCCVIVGSCILILFFSCSGSGDGGGGNIAVKLELPKGVNPSIFSSDDRIVVKISGLDFPEMNYEFVRSQSQGSIKDIPEGVDRVIKVDEYDIQGNLLARGFAYGLNLMSGEDTIVSVEMVPKNWVITIAGGKGAGNSPNGTYARDALLNGPTEVEYFQGKLFISDLTNRNIKIIDDSFKIFKIGNIADISILNEGDSLADKYLPFPIDFIVDDYLYCLAADLQIFSFDFSSVQKILYTENPGIILLNDGHNTLAGKNGQFFYSDFNDNKIYQINNGVKEIYIQRGIDPKTIGEGINKDNYGLLNPTGLYFDGEKLYFSDSGNNKIKFVENDLVFTLIGSYVENEFFDGILASDYNVKNPDFVKLYLNNFYISELDTGNILIMKENRLYIVTSNGNSPGSILEPLPPFSSGLMNVRDLTVDPDGNIYVADTGNNAIRMVVGGAL